MEFIDQINSLSEKIKQLADHTTTEEATKNAFVMPFIALLGYDVFNPMEVVPEFTADVGTKKGEKVDYAILKEGKPIILIECKCCGSKLDENHAAQLFRYFSVSEARLGILTDGTKYRFYSDLEEPNKMDPKPFLELDLLDLQEQLIEELRCLRKTAFDVDEVLSAAMDLKYTKEIKTLLGEQLSNPSEDFMKFFVSKVYPGKVTQKVKEQFYEITKRALRQYVNEQIRKKLKSALSEGEVNAEIVIEQDNEVKEKSSQIVTTEKEIEGYHIVKSLLRETVDPSRIHFRDAKTYFNILLDDNNRKPICRLYFNSSQKQIATFGDNREEVKSPIESLNDIYNFSDQIKNIISYYDNS